MVVAVFLMAETVYGSVVGLDLMGKGPFVSAEHGFSIQTEKIVEAHLDDFDYETFDSFMESKGGAENYVRSLGGVFEKWCGVQGNVQTAEEFQEVAEYVLGVMAIWGPDYHGGSGDHKLHGSWRKRTEFSIRNLLTGAGSWRRWKRSTSRTRSGSSRTAAAEFITSCKKPGS